MEFKFVLGVDMSKEWFHFCLMNAKFEILWEHEIENKPASIDRFLKELLDLDYIEKFTDVLLAIEYTGIYVQHLTKCWLTKGGKLTMIHASKIPQNLAGQLEFEEKTDSIDARRIAEYAFRFSDKLKLWQAKEQTIDTLQKFQRQRERLIKAINLLEVPVNESIEFDNKAISQALIGNQTASIKALKADLKQLEKTIKELIESDPYLEQLFKLITSVVGVGPVTAREIIIATNGFIKFLPQQAKAFSKYVGVVPNKKESGKSIRKKNKIGKRQHKDLKRLLTTGATSLIGKKSELAIFYQRKKSEGKHHLQIINAMRNKLILRVFAVVRNQVIYDKNLNLNLD